MSSGVAVHTRNMRTDDSVQDSESVLVQITVTQNSSVHVLHERVRFIKQVKCGRSLISLTVFKKN